MIPPLDQRILLATFAALPLLAAWWLFSCTIYFLPNWLGSFLTLAGAVSLLSLGHGASQGQIFSECQQAREVPGRARRSATGYLLVVLFLVAAAILLPWPYRLGPALLVIGLLTQKAPDQLPKAFVSVGSASFLAGLILVGQSIVLQIYLFQTMRWRDLPEGLVLTLTGALRFLGLPASSAGSNITVPGPLQPVTVPATWELVLDPASMLLWVGGLIALAWLILVHSQLINEHSRLSENEAWFPKRWTFFQALALAWTIGVFAGIVLRLAIVLGFHLQRLATTPMQVPVAAGDVFISPTLHFLLCGGITCLGAATASAVLNRLGARQQITEPVGKKGRSDSASSFPDEPAAVRDSRKGSSGHRPLVRSTSFPLQTLNGLGAGALVAGGGLLSFFFAFDPPGSPGACRVAVVERHSTWEPSDRPYDTEHFGHDPSYSYTLAYQYCEQYFQMARLGPTEPITADRLKNLDVLVIKIPTERWSREEIAAIVDFVRRGGGVLFIGDHTNVFNSSTYLNDLCRKFGFTFAPDLLFWIPDAYRQPWSPGFGAHPAVIRVPPLHFAVGCSVDPGRSLGRAVIASGGLWSLPCDFHVPNYHPVPQWRSDMRYGTFIQCWGLRFGRGKVLAFTDSTIFSNFCIFQPGKAELLRELIWWLCRRGLYDHPVWRWVIPVAGTVIGLTLVGVGLAIICRQMRFLLGLAGILAGWAFGNFAVDYLHRAWNPPPPVNQSARWVVIDRTTSRVPLALGAFSEAEEATAYGLLEQWISRLGYFTARRTGLSALGESGLLIICPTASPPPDFLDALIGYVASGGKLLVLDTPESQGTTANSLLWPFGLEVVHATSRGGKIRLPDNGPTLDVDSACEVRGGQAIAWIDELPVAAKTEFGAGRVMAIGFATLWTDANMGGHWMIAEEPTLFRRADLEPAVRDRFDALFAILRHWLEDQPLVRPPAPAAK